VFHPAMKHAGPVRKDLGVPTTFNFLGPLTNPAGVSRQVVGVADAVMAPKLADALAALGAEHAFVFRGNDGLDELTTTTRSHLWEIRDGAVTEHTFDPEAFGIELVDPSALRGGSASDNAAIAGRVFDGEAGPVADIVSLNAGSALVAAGVAADIGEGLARAREALASGRAKQTLERFREVSQALKA